MTLLILFTLLATMLIVVQVEGHGLMLDPPGRSSRWRTDNSAPANYDDNGLNCGGFGTQWSTNGGRCGMCGDSFSLSQPRPNELGGYFGGNGVIVRDYYAGTVIKIQVRITANHLGTIAFHLCNLDANNNQETEDCYLRQPLYFTDGRRTFNIGTTTGIIERDIALPSNLRCEHCVLRWTYRTGNNWGGPCDDGSSGMGCGPQEHFMACADVRIRNAGRFSAVRNAISVNETVVDVPIEIIE